MFECTVAMSVVAEHRDPRLELDYFRCVPRSEGYGSVLLIGVVHDHPASVFRVHAILDEFMPDVLALELPPLAVSLFRVYSEDGFTPPRLGGEMSTALKAAKSARVVGIDLPNRTFLRQLVGRVLNGRIPRSLFGDLIRDIVSSSAHAMVCRVGAAIGSITRLRLRLYSHIEYDCSLFDSPTAQADHESNHLAKQQAFIRSIEVPPARLLIDDLRDESMAKQLIDLRSEGDVVAVVGVEHLDPLFERLHRVDSGES